MQSKLRIFIRVLRGWVLVRFIVAPPPSADSFTGTGDIWGRGFSELFMLSALFSAWYGTNIMFNM